MVGGPTENVDEFKYLGSEITSDNKSKKDLVRRDNLVKTVFNRENNLYKQIFS